MTVRAFIDNILWNLMNINWEGSAMFAIAVLAILAIYRQWHTLLIILLTIVLGWGVQDIIIFNVETNMQVLSGPLLIYCTGGGIVLILSLISFLKMAL